MVEAIQADGNPTWLEQIHDRFLHPTDVSLSGYANEVLGEDDEDDLVDSGREEVPCLVVLLRRYMGLLRMMTMRRHLLIRLPSWETRKKARTEKSVRREEKKEGGAAGSSRKQPSTLPYLDYVVVSDTLSGLGPGEVRQGSDPDDKATLTEHMKKKALDDHKRHLDEQAAALLAAKRAKLQKDAPQPLLNLRLIWVCLVGVEGICWRRYLMLCFSPCFMAATKTGKKPRPVDISQITPPTSPPSRTVGLTPPQDDADASVKGGEGFFEGMFEGGNAAGGDVGGDAGGGRGGGGDIAGADRGKGIEVEVESSETTPQQTVYTKRPPGGGGATSGAVRDSRFFANGDLWGKKLWRLRRPRRHLLKRRKNLTQSRRVCNGGLLRLSGNSKSKNSLNEQKQKDWESACARTNTEMQSQRDAIVRLSGEKTALAEEAHQARLAAEKKEKEYVARIDKLELLVQEKASECEAAQRLLDEKTAECRASELLAEEASADSRWLLSRGVPLLADRILNSPELARYMFELGGAGYNSGRKNGYPEGRCAAVNNEKDYHFELFKEDCEGAYAAKRREFSMLDFAVVRAAGKLANKANGVALLKKALGDDGAGSAGGAGPSRP
ncbi:hypothetical protein HanPSC8_Chr02g0055591 [Helianthus annuus]|nr:hypothetical protein HanPSC8_Chr02g0055591 [Helianthus annuus]